jgi:hypothetical protein
MHKLKDHPIFKKEMRLIFISLIIMIILTGIIRISRELVAYDYLLVGCSYIVIITSTIFSTWRCLKIGKVEKILKGYNEQGDGS